MGEVSWRKYGGRRGGKGRGEMGEVMRNVDRETAKMIGQRKSRELRLKERRTEGEREIECRSWMIRVRKERGVKYRIKF